MRNHGITLDGPPIRDLVDDVPADALARLAATELPGTLQRITAWADMTHAWTQRYIVQTYSRLLCTARTGRVVSKPAALAWAMQALDPEWLDLLQQVAEDRARIWRPVDLPRPGSMQRAVAFGRHVEGVASAP